MKTPYLITKESVAKNYLIYYYGYDRDPKFMDAIKIELAKLSEVTTPDQIDQAHKAAVNKIQWGCETIFLTYCLQCNQQNKYPYIVIGENDDNLDSATTTLCLDCLKSAVNLIEMEAI